MSEIEINKDFYSIVDQILYSKKSLARFGDSEIRLMLGVDPKDYQQPSPELSKRLKEVIKCNSDNILIGINGTFKGYSTEPYVARRYWASFIRIYLDSFYRELNSNVTYVDSSFTRLYVRRNIKNVNTKFQYIKKFGTTGILFLLKVNIADWVLVMIFSIMQTVFNGYCVLKKMPLTSTKKF